MRGAITKPLCGACPFVGYCGLFSINYFRKKETVTSTPRRETPPIGGARSSGSGRSPDPAVTHPCGRGHLASHAGSPGEPGGRWRGSWGHPVAPARRQDGACEVELAQVAVLRGVVAQGPGQTGKSAGAACQGLWARLGPGRRCPLASRHGQKVPARASKAHGVRAARVAKIVTGMCPAAGPSVPSATVAIGLLKGRARTGLGQGSRAHLSTTPKVDRLEAAAPA